MIISLGSFIASMLVKKNILSPFKRFSYKFLNSIYLSLSFISFLIVMINTIDNQFKLILLFIRDFFLFFSYFGLFICLSNILLSFSPKSIESVFSSIFISFEILNYNSSLLTSSILLTIFDVDIKKGKIFNLNYIFLINILMIIFGFYYIN